MDRDEIGAGVSIPVDGFLWIRDHHVYVERHIAHALGNANNLGSKGEVRRKMAIHDIDVNEIGIGDFLQIPRQIAKVGGENRRRDFNVVHCCAFPIR